MQIDRPIRLFSGGNQQKAIIARWIAAGTQILLFDEPTRGIDIGAKAEIYAPDRAAGGARANRSSWSRPSCPRSSGWPTACS